MDHVLEIGRHRAHRRGSVGEVVRAEVHERASLADSRQRFEIRIAGGLCDGDGRIEVRHRDRQRLLRGERIVVGQRAILVEGREWHAGAIGLGEEHFGKTGKAERLRVTGVVRIEFVVRGRRALSGRTCTLDVEEDRRQRGVGGGHPPLVDHDSRRKRFGEAEFVGEQTREIHESLGSRARSCLPDPPGSSDPRSR
jgi:hypothetical protein